MKKIVVVDDNKTFLKTVKGFIEMQKDFDCVTFSNPEEALQYVLKAKKIHAVVSDYEMPQLDGFTLAKKIIEELPTIKMIVMSGHSTKHLRKIALKAEVDQNKVRLLSKSDIINLVVLLNN